MDRISHASFASMLWCCCGVLAAEPPRTDSYGDPLPASTVLRLGTTRLQAEGSFAWTSDGQSLVTMRRGTVYFWDLSDGHARETLLVSVLEPWYATLLALSANDKTLVCASIRGTLAVCDLETAKVIERQRVDSRNEQQIAALAVTPDGSTFATLDGEANEIRIWDAASCEIRRRVPLRGKRAHEPALAFPPDGMLLAAGAGPTILLIPTDGGETSEISDAHGEGAWKLEFSSDGKTLISAGGAKYEKRLTPDGKPYIHSQPQLRVWNVAERKMQFELAPALSESDSFTADLGPDNRTIVTAHHDRLQIWDLATRSVVRSIHGIHLRNPQYAKVGIDPTGRYVAIASGNYVEIWNLTSGETYLATGQHHNDGIRRVAWSPDGSRIATGDGHGNVRVWNGANGKVIHSLKASDSGVFCLEFSPDGMRLVTGGDEYNSKKLSFGGRLLAYDVTSGATLTSRPFPARVRQVVIDADGKRAAVAVVGDAAGAGADPFAPTQEGIQLLHLDSGKVERELRMATGGIEALAWPVEGKGIAYVGSNTKVRHVDVNSGELISEFTLPHPVLDQKTGQLVPGGLFDAIFLRGGRSLITVGGTGELYCWLVGTGEQQWQLPSGAKHIRALAASPDGRMFAGFCSDGDRLPKKLRVWDATTQKLLQEVDAGLDPADTMAFSPDGSRIVIGYYNGTALVYDLSQAIARQD